MEVNVIVSMMGQIDDLAKLDELLTARDAMRRVYAEMQTAYFSSRNPLFKKYAEIVAGSGQLINAEIRAWHLRAAMKHGEVDFEDVYEEGDHDGS